MGWGWVGDLIFEEVGRDCPRFGGFWQVYAGFYCPALAFRTVSVDFTEHGVPEGGCTVPFQNNVGEAFQGCIGWGGVGDDMFEKLGRDGHGFCRVWICQSLSTKNMQQRERRRE